MQFMLDWENIRTKALQFHSKPKCIGQEQPYFVDDGKSCAENSMWMIEF